jgi:hypothetical protein
LQEIIRLAKGGVGISFKIKLKKEQKEKGRRKKNVLMHEISLTKNRQEIVFTTETRIVTNNMASSRLTQSYLNKSKAGPSQASI